jgi:hypothetical protein
MSLSFQTSVDAFAGAAMPWPVLLARYKEMHAHVRRGQADTAVQEEYRALRERVAEGLTLRLLTASEEDSALRRQIIGRDDVHDFGQRSDAELLTYRIGGPRANKRAFALCDENNAGSPEILAVLYTYWSALPGGMDADDYDGIPEKAQEILQAPLVDVERPGVVVCYSITNFQILPGTGEMLIAKLLEGVANTMPDLRVATLSPLRRLDAWLNTQNGAGHNLAGDALRDATLRYLLANSQLPRDFQDGPERFHLGNGAYIGAIRLDAGAVGSRDEREGRNVMITYGYPLDPERRGYNRMRYRAGEIYELLSGDLQRRSAAFSARSEMERAPH